MHRKIIFDTVRRMLGRGFTRHEVAALDTVLDEATQDDAAPVLLGASPAGIALIKRFEGCAKIRADGLVEAYPDPGSSLSRAGSGSGAPWTIGWGATGPGIGPGTVWTCEECDARLEADVARHAAQVLAAIGTAATSQNQFDALVSFHYNTGAIARATLTARHNAGNFAGAAREFARWNRAGGRVLSGLVRRRAEEAKLYGR